MPSALDARSYGGLRLMAVRWRWVTNARHYRYRVAPGDPIRIRLGGRRTSPPRWTRWTLIATAAAFLLVGAVGRIAFGSRELAGGAVIGLLVVAWIYAHSRGVRS